MDNLKHMQSALALAKKGCGFVNPNPMVGAVIVKNGKVIGQGWHEYFGGPHAERNALRNCTDSPEGAVLYVTLELLPLRENSPLHRGHNPQWNSKSGDRHAGSQSGHGRKKC